MIRICATARTAVSIFIQAVCTVEIFTEITPLMCVSKAVIYSRDYLWKMKEHQLSVYTIRNHVLQFAVTGYLSKSGTRAPPREYYAWWSQKLLSVYRLDNNKDNCG